MQLTGISSTANTVAASIVDHVPFIALYIYLATLTEVRRGTMVTQPPGSNVTSRDVVLAAPTSGTPLGCAFDRLVRPASDLPGLTPA